MQACIWYFSEGSTLINLNLQIDYDPLENAFCSLRAWTGTSWETVMNFSYDAESLRPKKKPQTPVKRLASTIQSPSALQTSSCIPTLLSYWCQSKGGMNPPWLCLSADYSRSLGETQSYKYSWDESNPKRMRRSSTKLPIDSRRAWKTQYHAASWLSTLLTAGDSRWVCQGGPCRGHREINAPRRE